MSAYTRKILFKSARSIAGIKIDEIGIDSNMKDHVHLVMNMPPKHSRSAVIGRLKKESSSKLRHKFTFLNQVYWREDVVWSRGFFLSTVGVNKDVILNYVKWQGKQDLGQSQLKLGL